jgi:hypothetical protein
VTDGDDSQEESSVLYRRESAMPTTVLTQRIETPIARVTCVHGRIIDDVLGEAGERTGKVRCAECGAVFDDPFHGLN